MNAPFPVKMFLLATITLAMLEKTRLPRRFGSTDSIILLTEATFSLLINSNYKLRSRGFRGFRGFIGFRGLRSFRGLRGLRGFNGF